MIPVSDTLVSYAKSAHCKGDDFLAVFRWLVIYRKTKLNEDARMIADIIAGDQDELTANRAAIIARLRAHDKRRRGR